MKLPRRKFLQLAAPVRAACCEGAGLSDAADYDDRSVRGWRRNRYRGPDSARPSIEQSRPAGDHRERGRGGWHDRHQPRHTMAQPAEDTIYISMCSGGAMVKIGAAEQAQGDLAGKLIIASLCSCSTPLPAPAAPPPGLACARLHHTAPAPQLRRSWLALCRGQGSVHFSVGAFGLLRRERPQSRARQRLR
jgi:hypothetical protein